MSVTPVQHWIYPANPEGGFSVPVWGRQRRITHQNLHLHTKDAPTTEWFLHSGFHKMRPDDFVWIYLSGHDNNIRALAHALDEPFTDKSGGWSVTLLWDGVATNRLMRRPIPYDDFRQNVQTPQRANPVTLSVLRRWLNAEKISELPLDVPIDESLGDEDSRQRVLASVVRRQGQAVFREALLKAYRGRCVISGCDVQEVLEAAHIRPYQGPHTNMLSNGLLLRADLHTLFDLHLLGVDANGRIVLAPQLRATPEYGGFHGQHLTLPLSPAARPSRTRLAAHVQLVI